MQHQQQPADTAQTTAADAVPDENSAPVEEQLSKKPFATLMRVMRKAKADELEFQRKAAAALKQQTNQEVEQEHKEKHARMGPFQSIATLMRRKKNAPAPAAEPPSASLETAAEAVSSSSKETQDAVVPHSDVVVHDGAPIEAEPLNAAAAEFIPAHVSDAPKEPAILASSIPLEAAQPLALDSEPLPLTETAPDRDTLEPAPVPEFQDETATTTEAQTGDDHPELTLESHEKPAAIAETPTEQAEAEKSVEESNGEGSATTGSELNSKVEDEAKRKSAFSTLMRRFQKPKKPETTQEAGSQTAEIEEAETQEVSTQAAAGTLDAETQFVEPAQPEPFEKDIEKPAKQNR